jgi:hypothetical protein
MWKQKNLDEEYEHFCKKQILLVLGRIELKKILLSRFKNGEGERFTLNLIKFLIYIYVIKKCD